MVLIIVKKFFKILIKTIRLRERTSSKTVNFYKQRVITAESMVRYGPLSNLKKTSWYEGCSNMNASSFITFFTYMLRQNVIPFWKELFVAFKMASNIKKHSLYFSSYKLLYKGHSCILKCFLSKLHYTF